MTTTVQWYFNYLLLLKKYKQQILINNAIYQEPAASH